MSQHPMLAKLIAPRSVAVLGASDQPAKPGGRPLDYLRKAGYRGAIYPINPARQTVQGLRAYASLSALPEVPDLVVVAVAAKDADAAIDQCIAAGVEAAIVYTAGFAETGEAGAIAQQRLVQRARTGGLRLLGPNTQGYANFSCGAVLNFSGMLGEFDFLDGPIAVISQSGAGGGILWNGLRRLGLGVRYLAATGNEADICVGEMAEAVLSDPTVSLVLLYLESLRNPPALARAARLATERGATVLAIKAGRTSSGQLTASSHTGALAGEDAVADAFLRQHGILRLDNFDDMVQCAQVFAVGTRARGKRVVSLSNSGAACVLAADAAEDEGLQLTAFDTAGEDRLRALLPSFVTARNPIDMSTALYTQPEIFRQTLELINATQAADLVQIGMPAGVPGVDFSLFAREAAQFMRRSGLPLAVSVTQDWVGEAFRGEGVPVFRSERAAMRALAMLCPPGGMQANTAAPQPPASAQPGQAASHALNEAESLALLAQAGLPTVQHQVCHSADEVREVVAAWNATVVLKGLSRAVIHKSELGLVRLNQNSAEQAAMTCEELQQRMRAAGVPQEGVLVARQEAGDFELVVGAHDDPVFGPVVMVGQGGVLVEAVRDIQFLVAPFTALQARQALGRLHLARALGSTRGLPAVELEGLCALLVRLGEWMHFQRGRVASVDANPVIVRRGAQAPVLVDAVVMVYDTFVPPTGLSATETCHEHA